MKRTESTVTITKDELINAMAEAMAIMVHEKPATMLIVDALTQCSVLTVKNLFKED